MVQVVSILLCEITERLTGLCLQIPPEMEVTHLVKLHNVHVYILDLLRRRVRMNNIN